MLASVSSVCCARSARFGFVSECVCFACFCFERVPRSLCSLPFSSVSGSLRSLRFRVCVSMCVSLASVSIVCLARSARFFFSSVSLARFGFVSVSVSVSVFCLLLFRVCASLALLASLFECVLRSLPYSSVCLARTARFSFVSECVCFACFCFECVLRSLCSLPYSSVSLARSARFGFVSVCVFRLLRFLVCASLASFFRVCLFRVCACVCARVFHYLSSQRMRLFPAHVEPPRPPPQSLRALLSTREPLLRV